MNIKALEKIIDKLVRTATRGGLAGPFTVIRIIVEKGPRISTADDIVQTLRSLVETLRSGTVQPLPVSQETLGTLERWLETGLAGEVVDTALSATRNCCGLLRPRSKAGIPNGKNDV